MNIFTRHKNILLTIIALILVFFGYWYFVLSKKDSVTTQNSTGGALVKSTDGTPSATAGAKSYDREFVAGLLSLNTINIDVAVFDSVAYKALSFPEKPFTVNYDIPYGRQNPFLPIGVNAVGISSAITTQQTQRVNNATTSVANPAASTTPAVSVAATTTASTTRVNPSQRTFAQPATTTRR